ncbi:MAG: response regulator [Desulfobacterales bacterium]|nr:response regulator [Desulfobacterales bacterium]MBF0397252.1 response regulator [Desulfobacterales bacterium]
MRILSVDDSLTIRQTIQNMVEVLDVDFIEAENGDIALKLLESLEGRIDLILLDWEMPVMNGYDFLVTIKKDKRFRSIPVIMLTQVSQKEKMISAIKAGAKQYITKPFTNEDLIIKIMQALNIDNLEDLKKI